MSGILESSRARVRSVQFRADVQLPLDRRSRVLLGVRIPDPQAQAPPRQYHSSSFSVGSVTIHQPVTLGRMVDTACDLAGALEALGSIERAQRYVVQELFRVYRMRFRGSAPRKIEESGAIVSVRGLGIAASRAEQQTT